MKVYRSFEEIDRDLKILKLQREIDKEKMIIGTKTIKDSFSLVGISASIAGRIAKKAFVLKAINRLLGLNKSKKPQPEESFD